MSIKIDKQLLIEHARTVLSKNDLGTSTKPALQLYPHQWNWDSAFIAIGLSHINEGRAQTEIKSLLKAQWPNGMVPHIVFNPDEVDYHPGPDYWSTDIPNAPRGITTSGITQPPIISYAALEVYHNSRNKRKAELFLREIYKDLLLQVKFLLTDRDPLQQGLSFICHPWESGMDNATNWDIPLNSFDMDFQPNFMRRDNQNIEAEQRPTDNEYTRYSYLVQRYAMEEWNQAKIHSLNLFLVQSVLFNALQLKSLQALSSIATIIGEDSQDIDNQIQSVQQAFAKALWNSEISCYQDIDISTGKSIIAGNLGQFIPLFAGLPTKEQAKRLITELCSPDYWPEQGWGIASQSIRSTEFDANRYWRGPVWVNMNWMIIKGLEQYNRSDLANRLAHETLQLVEQSGFYEYFNPKTGQGLGSDSFSWTAALVIDLLKSDYR